MIIQDLFENKTVAEGAQPTEKVSAVIKRVLGDKLLWGRRISQLIKSPRANFDRYQMLHIRVYDDFGPDELNPEPFSANEGQPLAKKLKRELIKAGYPVSSDLLIYPEAIMFNVRKPTTTAEQGVAEGEYKSRHIHRQEQNKKYDEYRRNQEAAGKKPLSRGDWAATQRKGQQGVAEGAGNIGAQIRAAYQRIYDQGDDAVEFAYYDSPIFAQYWDEYEGDLDSIIAEVDPSELQIILDELTSAAENQGVAEAIVGKPRYSEPHQSGRGFYSAADYMVRTNHQLGSHAYTAVTQVDADNDRYYFIYQKGNKEPVFYATDMGRFEVRTDKLGNRISNAIITAHREATDHDLEKYMSGDDESEWDQEQGVAEAGPFSYGSKAPRKGSVADLAAKKHKEQQKGKQPVEPKDQMVGVAKVITKGVAEGSNDWSGPLYDPALQGNGKKQRYEMMFKNGQVKRFSAMNDNEARKIAAGHGAKSFIRMKGNVPGDKIKEQGVAEGRPNVGRHTGDKTVRVVRRGGKPIGEIGIDAEASPGQGQYYVKLYDGSVDLSGYDTAQEALEELRSALGLKEDTPVPTAMGAATSQATAPAQSQAQSAALATAQQQQQKREMQDEIKNKQAEISQLQKSMVSV